MDKKTKPMRRTGKVVQQLDYYTGELIEEYKSIQCAAIDNWISFVTLSKALNKHDGILNQKKLRFKFKLIN